MWAPGGMSAAGSRYLDWQAQIRPGSGEGLKQTLERLADQAPVPREDAVIRVTVSGAAQPEEYEARQQIYEAVFGGFLFWKSGTPACRK